MFIVSVYNLLLRFECVNDLDETHFILSKNCCARINLCLDRSDVRITFSFHNECSTTYNSSLQECIEAETFCYCQNNDWHYVLDNESKLSLNSECHNIFWEEKWDALNECIQFLDNILIDTIVVWELLSAIEYCVVNDHVLIVICVAEDSLSSLLKCHTFCLSRLFRNIFLKKRVVLIVAIHMQSVVT